jgi:hypothetical protein
MCWSGASLAKHQPKRDESRADKRRGQVPLRIPDVALRAEIGPAMNLSCQLTEGIFRARSITEPYRNKTSSCKKSQNLGEVASVPVY